MNDYPLLRVGILLSVFLTVGFVLYATFGPEIQGWLSESSDGKIQIGVGRDYAPIVVNGEQLKVEIANTPEQTRRGLSGRESLGDDEGMLFIFNDTRRHIFWMNGMNFDLDIIWIRDGTVVEIATLPAPMGVEPPASYRPDETADMVLEINAGRAEELDIEIGTEIIGLP